MTNLNAPTQKDSDEQLVLQYLPFARRIAKTYENRGVDLEDLVQEAVIGLMHAARKFDPERNVDFSTYAIWWIRNAITRAVSAQSRTMRIPHNRIIMTYRLIRISRQLYQELQREPTAEEIAEHVTEKAMTPAMIAEMLKQFQHEEISIHALMNHTDETLADHLIDETQDPEHVFSQQRNREQLSQLLQYLNKEERSVIALRFGLIGGKEHSYEEIGRKVKKSAKTVVNLENRAMLKLKRTAHFFERE